MSDSDDVDSLGSEEVVVKPKRRKRKKNKDPNRPKRNMSAFFLYSNANRARVKADNPDAKFGDIAKLLSAEFKEIDADEKAEWDAKAEADKQRYLAAMEDYVPPSDDSDSDSEDGGKKKKKKKKSGKAGKETTTTLDDSNSSTNQPDEQEENQEQEEPTRTQTLIEGKLVGRDEDKDVTMINVKGRIVKIKNDMIESVKLPKAKREKGAK
mmetsp:Transcript_30924/g.48461  ORF Transcript_30924/g.48461 Transcript_30924/m.48461 type:complete len:210 (-) Transcript_30924:116-745(-)